MTQPNNPLKRIAAFVLVLVLAAGSIPMPVLAAYDDTHNIFIAPDEYEPAEPYPSYGYEAEQIIAPPPVEPDEDNYTLGDTDYAGIAQPPDENTEADYDYEEEEYEQPEYDYSTGYDYNYNYEEEYDEATDEATDDEASNIVDLPSFDFDIDFEALGLIGIMPLVDTVTLLPAGSNWEDLRAAVDASAGLETLILLQGDITSVTGTAINIPAGTTIHLQSALGGTNSHSLYQHNTTAGGAIARRHFHVDGGELHLGNVHLTRDLAAVGAEIGGGVHVAAGSRLYMAAGSVISNNAAVAGGGVYAMQATVTIDGGEVSYNRTTTTDSAGAGLRIGLSELHMTNGLVRGNESLGAGAGIALTGASTGTINNSILENNINEGVGGAGTGGAIFLAGEASMTLGNGTIIRNNEAVSGAAVGMSWTTLPINLTINDVIIEGNTATNGGALSVAGGGTTVMTAGVIRDNHATGNGGAMRIADNTIFQMLGGTIGGTTPAHANTAVNGGGVWVGGGAEFTMDGADAVIRGNEATGMGTNDGGGGVFVIGGSSFYMHSGTIEANNSLRRGGGVLVEASYFDMYGGVIRNNHAANGGGGVNAHLGSIFNMTAQANGAGGQIYNNETSGGVGLPSPSGGGVFVQGEGSVFTMSSGTIGHDNPTYGNAAERSAGGVFIANNGVFNMQAHTDGGALPRIIGNTASGTILSDGGGGVNIWIAEFNMHDGIIENNRALHGGGVFLERGAFNLHGGTIQDNRYNATGVAIAYGGGVRADGNLSTFTQTGGTIEDNTAVNGGGVWVGNGATFTAEAGSIINNTAGEDGGGIWTDTFDYNRILSAGAYGNLDIAAAVVFEGNTAGNGAFLPPTNPPANIATPAGGPSAGVPGLLETPPLQHTLNNYDINFRTDLVEVTVTFDPTDGAFAGVPATPLQTRVVTEGETYAAAMNALNHLVNPGVLRPVHPDSYIFAGWYNAGGARVINLTTVPHGVGDHTLYARWLPPVHEDDSFEVDFLWNHTSVPAENNLYARQTVIDGDTVNRPVDPSLTDYLFLGWSLTPAGPALFDFDTPITGNLRLYAQWEATPGEPGDEFAPVRFYWNRTATEWALYHQESVIVGQPVGQPANPERDGYTFVRWSTEREGGTAWNFNTQITDAGAILFAQWSEIDPTLVEVIFIGNGGTPLSQTRTVTVGGTYAAAMADIIQPTRTGWVFQGWFTQAIGGTRVLPGDTVTRDYNHNLFAQWERSASDDDHTVRFMWNTSATDNDVYHQVTVLDGDTVVPPATPTREGYVFTGWTTDRAGANAFDFNTPITADRDLFAQWRAEPGEPGDDYVIVDFVWNRYATDNELYRSVSVVVGGTVGAFAPPLRDGYVFLGWFTARTGGTEFNFATAIHTDTTVYARWELAPAGNYVLAVNKTADVLHGSYVRVGQVITYTISASNIGSVSTGSILIQDIIPNGMSLVQGSAVTRINGVVSTAVAPTFTNGVLVWTFPYIAAGATVTVSFQVTVNPLPAGVYNRVFSNTATVGERSTNTVELTTQGLVKRPDRMVVNIGETINWTLRGFHNPTGEDVTNFTIVDMPGLGLNFQRGTLPAFHNGEGVTYEIRYTVAGSNEWRTHATGINASQPFTFSLPQPGNLHYTNIGFFFGDVPADFGLGSQIVLTFVVGSNAPNDGLVNNFWIRYDEITIPGQSPDRPTVNRPGTPGTPGTPPQQPGIVIPPPPGAGMPYTPWGRAADPAYIRYDDPPYFTPIDPAPIDPIHHAFMIGFREDGTIRPQANITRAEVTTIFFRLITDQHRANIWSQTNSFADVQLERWFNNPISTMERGGLFAGLPLGSNFNPNQAATRAEFAAMVVNHLGLGHYRVTGGNAFTDIGGHWASDAINVAYLQGWVRGFGDGTFRPDQLITRAEVAALVNRALGRLPETADDLLPGMIMWPDNMNPNTWYFLYIQEATNSHHHQPKEDGIHETWTHLIDPRNWRALERPYSMPWDILGQ